jgi:hypothetical protein
MKITFTRFLQAALTAALLAGFLAAGLSREFYSTTLVNVFYCVILAVSLIFLLAVRPWFDVAPVLVCTVALAVVDFAVLDFPRGRPATTIVPVLSFLGLSSLLVLGFRTIWSPPSPHDAQKPRVPGTPPGGRKLLLCAFVPAMLFAVSEYSATTMLEVTGRLHPRTLDLYLYSFEGSLGTQLSFQLGRMFARFPWFRVANLLFYIAVPVPMVVAYAGQLRRKKSAALPVILAILISGPLGILFFNLFPAGGPLNVFGGAFPWRPLSMADTPRLFLEPIRIGGWRNAIPSLHMTWTMLAWWNARGLARGTRLLILVFLAFTVTSTMGTGEHWFVDLVVAVPFALMIQALANYVVPLRDRRRWLPFAGGAGMTLGWLALLRFVPRLWWVAPIVLPWTLVVATVAVCLYLERTLSAEAASEAATESPEKLPAPVL